MNKPKINTIYQHYKGNLYRVICNALQTETNEELVIYVSLDMPNTPAYARPLSMWFELINGVQRFTEYKP